MKDNLVKMGCREEMKFVCLCFVVHREIKFVVGAWRSCVEFDIKEREGAGFVMTRFSCD